MSGSQSMTWVDYERQYNVDLSLEQILFPSNNELSISSNVHLVVIHLYWWCKTAYTWNWSISTYVVRKSSKISKINLRFTCSTYFESLCAMHLCAVFIKFSIGLCKFQLYFKISFKTFSLHSQPTRKLKPKYISKIHNMMNTKTEMSYIIRYS